MSVENFCKRFPASTDVRGIIEDIRSTDIKTGKSLIAILAEQLVREGRDGLREIIKELNPGQIMLRMTLEDFRRISASEENRQKIFINYASVFFGLAVGFLETSLIEREYNHQDWPDEERYPSNTQSQKEGREKLLPEKLNDMYSIVKKDKTFGLFFEEEGIQAMPDAMQELLKEKEVLPIIRESILPLYRQRAQFLVDTKK